MPELNTFACDVCGATKREVNRWWIATALLGPNQGAGLSACGFVCYEFTPAAWEAGNRLSHSQIAVACGEEHAQQLFARWLVSGSFDAPSQRPIARSAATPGCAEDEQVPQSGMPALQDSPTGKEEA